MYTAAQIQELRQRYLSVRQAYYRLMFACLSFQTVKSKSREYIIHGLSRRLGVLQRCIENIYSTYPPERSDIPTRDERVDLEINLQTFALNVFGCIDNLAWIWVTERALTTETGEPLRSVDVSFHNKLVRKTLPDAFRLYLAGLKNWFRGMGDFRHALAHRIPLYVPPYTVSPADEAKHDELERQKGAAMQRRNFTEYERLDAEQTRLGRFTPAMTHSHSENPGVVNFHSQVLADWNTVVQIADKFLAQLDNFGASRASR